MKSRKAIILLLPFILLLSQSCLAGFSNESCCVADSTCKDVVYSYSLKGVTSDTIFRFGELTFNFSPPSASEVTQASSIAFSDERVKEIINGISYEAGYGSILGVNDGGIKRVGITVSIRPKGQDIVYVIFIDLKVKHVCMVAELPIEIATESSV